MIWVYIASAVFGCAFVVPMLLGALDLEAEVDADFDADLDPGMDLDVETDAGGIADGLLGSVGDFVGSLLSFRSLVMAATFFGLAGIVFSLISSSLVAFVTAVGLGLVAAVVNGQLVQFINRNEASSHLTDRDVQGSSATVVLPLGPDRKGRIRAEVAGQTEYFVALPFKEADAPSFEVGDAVVIVDVQGGTARVAPLPALDA